MMLRSMIKFSGFTVLSKISGFIRDLFLIYALGIGYVSDIFFIAFRLPNLFRAILAEGAFGMVFTPLYTEKHDRGDSEMGAFVNNIFTMLLIMSIALCACAELLMPILIIAFAPGLDIDSKFFDSCLHVARIMFPYLAFTSLCAMLCGILQSERKFAFVSLNPIVLNVAIIVAALISPNSQSALIMISSAVIIAGIIQLAIALIVVKIQTGYIVRPILPKINSDSNTMLSRFTMATVGSCATRISVWVDTVIASIIPNAVTYIYYADRLYQIPRSLIGVAISYVILPELTRAIKRGDISLTQHLLSRALEVAYLLCVPAAVFMAVLSERAANLLFLFSSLSTQDHVQHISRVILIFALSIPAVTTITIINTIFFANGNTKTPVKLSLICIIISVLINISIISKAGYLSVPIAAAVSSWTNSALLMHNLRKNMAVCIEKRLTERIGMFCIASGAMAFSVAICDALLINVATGYVMKLAIFLFLGILGLGTYITTLKLTKTYSIQDIKSIFDYEKNDDRNKGAVKTT